MRFSRTAALAAIAGVMLSASCVLAKVGGGNEMPNDGKAKGTASGGTEDKSMQSEGLPPEQREPYRTFCGT